MQAGLFPVCCFCLACRAALSSPAPLVVFTAAIITLQSEGWLTTNQYVYVLHSEWLCLLQLFVLFLFILFLLNSGGCHGIFIVLFCTAVQ